MRPPIEIEVFAEIEQKEIFPGTEEYDKHFSNLYIEDNHFFVNVRKKRRGIFWEMREVPVFKPQANGEEREELVFMGDVFIDMGDVYERSVLPFDRIVFPKKNVDDSVKLIYQAFRK